MPRRRRRLLQRYKMQLDFTGGTLPAGNSITRASSSINEGSTSWPSVGSNTASFKYDPSAGKYYLSICPQFSNRFAYSLLTNVSGEGATFPEGIVVTKNVSSTPISGLLSGRLATDTTNNYHFVYKNQDVSVPFTIGDTGLYSVWAKYEDAQFIQLLADGFNGTSANFDLVNKTCQTSDVGISCGIVPSIDGWILLWMKGTASTVTNKYGIGIVTSLSSARRQSFTGTGQHSLFFGQQLSKLSSVGSTVITTGTIVTRAADTLTNASFAGRALRVTYRDGTHTDLTMGAGTTIDASQLTSYEIEAIAEI